MSSSVMLQPLSAKSGRIVWVLLTILVMIAGQFVLSQPAAAHALPTNTIMNAFVKIEPKQAELVVRIPMDLLPGLPLPQKGSNYDLAAAAPAIQIALLTLPEGFLIFENGARLTPSKASGRMSPTTDRSFESFETAAANSDKTTDPKAVIPYDQGYFDLHLTYPIATPKSDFKIQAQVAADLGDRTKLAVRYIPFDESSRAMLIAGGSGPVTLNPAWYVAAGSFIELGIDHILTGIDHLLFLFCLVIPFRRMKGLLSVITAFTLAHSVTLFASAFHLAPRGAWFPPLVETGIAASIVYMALENVVGPDLRRRWLITGMFGLVHGFGFSNALGEALQFAGSYLLVSLFAFNIGIEIGQLCVLALMLPLLALLRRLVPERALVIGLSGVGACVGSYWMIERWQVVREIEWPQLAANALVTFAQWTILLVICMGFALVLARQARRKGLELAGEKAGEPAVDGR